MSALGVTWAVEAYVWGVLVVASLVPVVDELRRRRRRGR